jgi:hypothetical protein
MDYVGLVVSLVISLAIMVFFIIVAWKIFTKAGKPGWAVLVPFYNIIVMLNMLGKPAWWIILFFIPIANPIIPIILTFELAKVFGKSTGFGFGLLFLGFIFAPILAFGDAVYTPPAGA